MTQLPTFKSGNLEGSDTGGNKSDSTTSCASRVNSYQIPVVFNGQGVGMSQNNGLIFRILRADCDLKSQHRMVLLVLLNHWNPNTAGSIVWPGQPRIATHAGMTVRTVQRVLQELEDRGLIKIRIESGKSNRYSLNIDAIDALTHDKMTGVPTTKEQIPTTKCRTTPDKMSYECLTECPTNPLRHSPKQREMPELMRDVLSNALNGKPKKKKGNQSRADYFREQEMTA